MANTEIKFQSVNLLTVRQELDESLKILMQSASVQNQIADKNISNLREEIALTQQLNRERQATNNLSHPSIIDDRAMEELRQIRQQKAAGTYVPPVPPVPPGGGKSPVPPEDGKPPVPPEDEDDDTGGSEVRRGRSNRNMPNLAALGISQILQALNNDSPYRIGTGMMSGAGMSLMMSGNWAAIIAGAIIQTFSMGINKFLDSRKERADAVRSMVQQFGGFKGEYATFDPVLAEYGISKADVATFRGGLSQNAGYLVDQAIAERMSILSAAYGMSSDDMLQFARLQRTGSSMTIDDTYARIIQTFKDSQITSYENRSQLNELMANLTSVLVEQMETVGVANYASNVSLFSNVLQATRSQDGRTNNIGRAVNMWRGLGEGLTDQNQRGGYSMMQWTAAREAWMKMNPGQGEPDFVQIRSIIDQGESIAEYKERLGELFDVYAGDNQTMRRALLYGGTSPFRLRAADAVDLEKSMSSFKDLFSTADLSPISGELTQSISQSGRRQTTDEKVESQKMRDWIDVLFKSWKTAVDDNSSALNELTKKVKTITPSGGYVNTLGNPYYHSERYEREIQEYAKGNN